jgi:hypothetical protein
VAARNLALALVASSSLGLGCAALRAPTAYESSRLRFISSQATQASWSFVVDDRARGAELLVDGRERPDCNRAGREIRCELRGLFPGGHTVELRLPGAILRRSVLLGKPFPERPLLVRVRTPEDAKRAAEVGADGVLVSASETLTDLQEITEAAHKAGARVVAVGGVDPIVMAGADAVLDAPIPPLMLRRFPEARTLGLDAAGSAAVAKIDLDAIQRAQGVIEAPGLAGASLALAAPRGAIVDEKAYPLLTARRKHSALRAGTASKVVEEPGRVAMLLSKAGDRALVVWNASDRPWTFKPTEPTDAIDLLGSTISDGELTVRPGDMALLVRSPQPDKTRY